MPSGYFNSRPHKEVDHLCKIPCFQHLLFQLTTSQGGRRKDEFNRWIATDISTHDLTRRSTVIAQDVEIIVIFQLTTSQGGRRMSAIMYLRPKQFQLTTSQGGRRKLCLHTGAYFYISTHDLTRRSTIYSVCETYFEIISTHDLTRRSTRHRSRLCKQFVYFNSRPHKEVDSVAPDYNLSCELFQLTTSQGGRRTN